MHKKKVLRALMVLLVLGVGAGVWWYASKHDRIDEYHLVLYGNVDIREVDLAFNNSEHVDQLLAQEGDRVHKGQLLATLHRARMQAEEAAAVAKVASQKAVVARLETGSRPEEIRQARANVAAAGAKLVDAEETYERTKRLVKKDAAARIR